MLITELDQGTYSVLRMTRFLRQSKIGNGQSQFFAQTRECHGEKSAENWNP